MSNANYLVQVKIDADTGGLVGEAKGADTALDNLGDAANDAAKGVKGTGSEADKTSGKLKKYRNAANDATFRTRALSEAASGLSGVLSGFAILAVGKQLVEMADQTRLLQSRVERLSESSADAAYNYDQLLTIATNTGTNLPDTVRLWESLTAALGELGYQQPEILELTDTLQKLGVVSGSSSEEMSNALRQLSQSFSAGIVRAEEYNSVAEQMPEIWRKVAAQLGITMGQLRQRMLDGNLSAVDVMESLKGAAEETNDQFEAMPRTAAQAATAIKTQFTNLVGTIDQKVGASKNLVRFMDMVTGQIVFANDFYQSFDESTTNLDARSIKAAQLSDQMDFLKNSIKEIKNLGLPPAIEAGRIQAAKEQLVLLQKQYDEYTAKTQSLNNTELGVAGTINNPDGGNKKKPVQPKKDPTKAEQAEANRAADYYKQTQQLGLDDLSALEASLNDEYTVIEQYQSKGYFSAQQAKDAKAAIWEQYVRDVDAIMSADTAEEARLEAEQIATKEAADKQLEQLKAQLASERELIDIEYQQRNEEIKALKEQGLIDDAEIKALELANVQAHQDAITEYELAAQQTRLNAARVTADGLAGIAGALFGEQSTAYKAMFVLSKSFAVAQGVLAMTQNIAEASKVGFPQNIPLIAGATAQGAGILSQIKSVQLAGQAHDGISRIPNEGTWNLAKGERVYTNESADQLDRMYERIMSVSGQSGEGGMSVQIINLVDPSLFSQYINSATGQRDILNTIDANSTEIANMLA